MTVERCSIQVEILTEGIESRTALQQKFDRANVTVIDAPLHQGHLIRIHGMRRESSGYQLEHKFRAAIGKLTKQRVKIGLRHRDTSRLKVHLHWEG
jgi:hypothetical protein